VNAGLGVRIALDAYGLARTFARARVGLSALAAHWKAAHVADTTVTFDTLKALQVHADLATQITFNDVLSVLNCMHNLRQLLLSQILGPNAWIDIGFGQNLDCVCGTNAVNVSKRDINALIRRNFNTNDACHKILSLPLFVAFVAANHANDALAPDDFAIFAKLFY